MYYRNLKNFICVLFCGLCLFSCKQNAEKKEEITRETTETNAVQVYEGKILAKNADANNKRTVTGDVKLTVEGNELTIFVEANGLEPNMSHLQHLHGFRDGSDTDCPGQEADKNVDGVVDVTEVAEAAGITMIPFHDDPVNLKIKTDTYPKADETGYLVYRQSVNLDSLKAAVKKEFGLEELDFTKFTYMIHGVPESPELPESAASVMDVPAHITLPVGCAELIPATSG